jgi:hypothetical protein
MEVFRRNNKDYSCIAIREYMINQYLGKNLRA